MLQDNYTQASSTHPPLQLPMVRNVEHCMRSGGYAAQSKGNPRVTILSQTLSKQVYLWNVPKYDHKGDPILFWRVDHHILVHPDNWPLFVSSLLQDESVEIVL
jgi:hypothetical protein